MGRRAGFTVTELMTVMAVIVVLASIVAPRFIDSARQAREAEFRAHLDALRDAITVFIAHSGDTPGTLEDLVAANGSPGTPTGDPASSRISL